MRSCQEWIFRSGHKLIGSRSRDAHDSIFLSRSMMDERRRGERKCVWCVCVCVCVCMCVCGDDDEYSPFPCFHSLWFWPGCVMLVRATLQKEQAGGIRAVTAGLHRDYWDHRRGKQFWDMWNVCQKVDSENWWKIYFFVVHPPDLLQVSKLDI